MNISKWLFSTFVGGLVTAFAGASIALVVPGGWSVLETAVVFFWIGVGFFGISMIAMFVDDF